MHGSDNGKPAAYPQRRKEKAFSHSLLVGDGLDSPWMVASQHTVQIDRESHPVGLAPGIGEAELWQDKLHMTCCEQHERRMCKISYRL